MTNGNGNGKCLALTEDEFIRMSMKQQNLVLFRNQVATYNEVRGFNVRVRVLQWIVGVISVGTAFLIEIHIIK